MSRIKVDRITDRAGTGEPLFPNGVKVVGLTSLSNVVAGIATFENVSVGGTLTYEDVTNVDSTGIVTARGGFKAGDPSGIGATIEPNGNAVFAGRLGIGVEASSSEGTELVVKGSDGATNFALVPNADTESTNISFYNAAYNSQQGYIKYNNNDNSLQVRVNLGERIRIGSAGQIGLSGANYGTSGQVLTSAGSGSAPSWSSLPAGGNQFTAVANGTIAAGKPVILESDSKVKQIAGTQVVRSSLGQPTSARSVSTDASYPCIAYDTDNSFFIHSYVKNGTVKLKANDFATNTMGSEVTATASGGESLGLFYDESLDKGIVFYQYNNQVYGEAFTIASDRTITVTGNRYGNGISYVSGVDYASLGNGKYIFAFKDTQANPDTLKVQCCTVAANGVITYGTAHTVLSDSECFRINIAADPTNQKAVICYTKSTDGEKGYICGLSISGTTITSGTPTYIVSGGQRAESMDMCFNASSGKYVVFWEDINNSQYGRANVITFSGTYTVSAAATQEIRTVNIDAWASVDLPNVTDALFVMYKMSTNGELEGRALTINSDGTLTLSGIAQYLGGLTHYGNNGSIDCCYVSNSAGTAYMTYQRSSSSEVFIKNTTVATTGSNANCNNIIGFSAAAYTDGQTATIKTVGNVIDNQSGLTVGTDYYIQGDGTLATSWDSGAFAPCATNANFGGTAIAADKLLIRDKNAQF